VNGKQLGKFLSVEVSHKKTYANLLRGLLFLLARYMSHGSHYCTYWFVGIVANVYMVQSGNLWQKFRQDSQLLFYTRMGENKKSVNQW